MKTYISQSSLARKLSVASATFTRKIKAGVVQPDAIAIIGTHKPIVLFDSEKVAEVRRAVVTRSIAGNPQIVA